MLNLPPGNTLDLAFLLLQLLGIEIQQLQNVKLKNSGYLMRN